MGQWYFRQHDGFADINQSSSAEAFEGSAIKDLATCVVRESLQNVLDVQLDESAPLRVRFTLGTDLHARNSGSPWFDGLMQHLQQPDSGAPEAPTSTDSCPFLLIEDFNTKGLVGNYREPYVPGTENNFVNFLYHDGLTGKSAKNHGSRGVGKIVFLLASRARSIFAYTIRANDSHNHPLLVGKSLLKFRKLNGNLFEPAAYFLDTWPTGGPREPVSDQATLSRFRHDFRLSRSTESGLSVVIPYIDAGITLDALRRAIVEEYHFAILSGKLAIELSDGTTIERIDTEHVPDIGDTELCARIDLARYAIANAAPSLETLPPAAGDLQRLSEVLVTDTVRESVRHALNQQERIAVRCLLHVHPKESEPVLTHFDVYLESAEKAHQRPIFVRQFLPVSGEGKPCSQLRALVLVRPGPLANLLRAAEGANHTQWSPRTDNFKRHYKGRLGEIDFVSTCVNRLIELVRGNATEPVGGISTFFFSAPLETEGPKSKAAAKKLPGGRPEVPDPPEADLDPRGYQFNQENGGFTLRGRTGAHPPERITIRVAYDVIHGSPWSDYDPDDFDLRKAEGEILINATEAQVERPDPGNRLIIKPLSESFEVVVSGFSELLDLIVDHRGASLRNKTNKEDTHDGETAELHEPQ